MRALELFLSFVQFLLEVGVVVAIVLIGGAFALDQIDGIRYRKAKRTS